MPDGLLCGIVWLGMKYGKRDVESFEAEMRALDAGRLKPPSPELLSYEAHCRAPKEAMRSHAPKPPPFFIHKLPPKNQSAFSRVVDAALFANLRSTMDGRQWATQQLTVLQEMADASRRGGHAWFWLHCRTCAHSVATTWAELVEKLGRRYPVSRLREKAWCSVCGAFGAHTQAATHVNTTVGVGSFPIEKSLVHHLDYLQHTGQLAFAIGARGTNHSVRKGLTLGQATLGALLASGYTFRTGQSWRGVGVSVYRGREHVMSYDRSVINHNAAERWREVHVDLTRDLNLMKDHFVMNLGYQPPTRRPKEGF